MTDLEAALRAADEERLDRPFDAIVVGAGAAGGLAAWLLTEAGLDVLVLDAGWRPSFWQAPVRRATAALVRSVADPRLQTVLPPKAVDLGRRALRLIGRARQPVQTRCFAWEMAPESFVDDRENPYLQDDGARFDWFRVRQMGGRMTVPGHGRQYYRLAERDFHPADGLSPDWPLEPGELDSWYADVEARLGLEGGEEHSRWIPDARVAQRLVPSAAEAQVMAAVSDRWPVSPRPILGRSAAPIDGMALAAGTGRLALRAGAVALSLMVSGEQARGVVWFDRRTGRQMAARAPVVFACASALESTRLLLNTTTDEGRPLGAASGALGRYLMDHVVVSGDGIGDGLPGEPVAHEPGRCVYLPRFDLREGRDTGRGYGVQVYRWSLGRGRSYFNAVSFAEMTPRAENRIVLDPGRTDAWGAPIPRILCRHDAAEEALARDQAQALADFGATLGIRFLRLDQQAAAPGTALHECGTARMGRAPETSVLDPGNQCWDARGLYVTDAAAFPSQGAQNPTLTLMALTARACAAAAGASAPAASALSAVTP